MRWQPTRARRLAALKVDGGMVGNELLMQFQADVLGIPVIRPRVTETTALGAAYAAGLAVGLWPGLDALRANWQADRAWQPGLDRSRPGARVPLVDESRRPELRLARTRMMGR